MACLSFSRDGSLLAAGSAVSIDKQVVDGSTTGRGQVRMWNTKSGTANPEMVFPRGMPTSVDCSPDHEGVAVGISPSVVRRSEIAILGKDSTVRQRRDIPWGLIRLVSYVNRSTSLLIVASPDRNYEPIVSGFGGMLSVLDLQTGKLSELVAFRDLVLAASIASDRSHVALAVQSAVEGASEISIFNVQTGRREGEVVLLRDTLVSALSLDPSRAILYAGDVKGGVTFLHLHK